MNSLILPYILAFVSVLDVYILVPLSEYLTYSTMRQDGKIEINNARREVQCGLINYDAGWCLQSDI